MLLKTNGKIKMINKIGFSSYQLAGVSDVLVNAWQMYFYTTFCNASIVTVTLMITIGKLIGATLTPVVGYISDNLYKTRYGKRFGRRKGILLIGIPLKILTFPLYWIPNMPIAYYASIIIITSFINPLLAVPQATFAAEMSENPVERAELIGFNQIGAAIAGISSSLIIIKLFDVFGQNNAGTFFIAAIIYDVISLIAFTCFYLSVYERPVNKSNVKVVRGKISIKNGFLGIINDFAYTIKIRSYRLYLCMYLSEQMFRSLAGTINTYFIVFVLLLNPKSVSISTSVGFVFGIMFLTFYIWLTAKKTGTFTYRIGGFATIIVLVCFMGLGIIRPTNTNIFLVILTVALNFGKTGLVNAAQFLFTFMPDIDEMITGKRREGAYAGVNTFLDVIFSTIEVMIIGLILQAAGFLKGAKAQPQITVHALLILYTVVPIILVIIGIISSYKLNLTVKSHMILEEEVNRLKSGGLKEDATEEIKIIVKDLTGFNYDDCWGNNNLLKYEHENRVQINKQG
ncbi:MFS transporter [Clostridium estertheticum]|uniref:MFS transporter n=1 Tax=Clostridium estertheticum TaxID=238834 RepID=UPI001CF1F5D1|nr:MFS transporter [Clostridium estertheticum]MCB2358091.1 MFS transporter [Clostridium estertheticum]